MSDPIAAAEAAGKARDIANRFETAVFLIAYGIAEKDGLYEADPHRYPYSQAFRHGMNILAALCAECSDDAEELLPTFNESDFIRNSAASDVREWTARWRDECREAVEGCRSIEIGPLASVDGDYFAATSECYEVLRFAENDLLGGHQERRVYEFLRAGTQEQYVYGRRMLIRHPRSPGTNTSGSRRGSPWATPTPSTRAKPTPSTRCGCRNSSPWPTNPSRAPQKYARIAAGR